MMGLMVLMFFAVYLLISIWATKKAANWAKANNKKPWVWGGLAAFVMYNLVFWDLIPTLVAHKYYCETQAGFWVYKTPEEWKKENPGVMETLKESLSPTRLNLEKTTEERTWVNQRFYIETTRIQILHSLNSTKAIFVDANTKEVIAKSTNFYRGVGNLIVSGGSLDEWRQAFSVSLGNRSCGDENKLTTDLFNQFVYQFWKSGEGK